MGPVGVTGYTWKPRYSDGKIAHHAGSDSRGESYVAIHRHRQLGASEYLLDDDLACDYTSENLLLDGISRCQS